jgi:phosphohistidine phosphatase
MRRLLLLRHAKTASAEPGESDRDRKLTERGRADAPVIGAHMAQHGLVPGVTLVSPAIRAMETWELVAPAFAAAPRLVTDTRIYNATPEQLLRIVREPREAPTLLVVGHNPGLHDLAVALIASGDAEARKRIFEALPTCGLVVLDFPFDDWSELRPHAARLERFVTPRLIASATE